MVRAGDAAVRHECRRGRPRQPASGDQRQSAGATDSQDKPASQDKPPISPTPKRDLESTRNRAEFACLHAGEPGKEIRNRAHVSTLATRICPEIGCTTLRGFSWIRDPKSTSSFPTHARRRQEHRDMTVALRYGLRIRNAPPADGRTGAGASRCSSWRLPPAL